MSQWVIEGSLGAILFNSRIIVEEDIQAALAEQQRSGGRFGEVLVRLGIVTAEDINWALSHHLDIPYIRLNREEMDTTAATYLPERIARRYCVIPVIRIGDELRVALVDPLDREAIKEIQAACNCVVSISIADERDVREMLDYLYGPEQKGSFGLFSTMTSAAESIEINDDHAGGRFLEWLLSLLARKGYRSITLMPTLAGGMITGRQGVVVQELGRLTTDACVRFAAQVRSRANLRNVSGAAARGSLEYAGEGATLTVQVSLLRGTDGEVVTLNQPELLDEAPFPPEVTVRLQEVTRRPGLVVVALPVEKTLRLMELFINEQVSAGKRVLVLGEGNTSIRESCACVPIDTLSPDDAEALFREALEHNPDILLVEHAGNIRRIIAAGRAALRGVHVMAATGAGIAETFALLFSAWRRHHLIPALLRGIVVGEVIPTLCTSCRDTLLLTTEEAALLRLPPTAMGYHHAIGCSRCGFTGHEDTRFLVEVIPCDRKIAELFETSGTSAELIKKLAQQGMYTIAEKAARLLVAGEISPDTYLRVVTA
jgi:type II secretory ATPase GspE/PulE/Tfp pilus assembly ATPase PilB-like protein